MMFAFKNEKLLTSYKANTLLVLLKAQLAT
jgi:hypothetical protein